MRSVHQFATLAMISGLAVFAGQSSVQAQVIYEDNYTTRLVHGNILGQTPNVVTTGGTYQVTTASAPTGDPLTYFEIGNTIHHPDPYPGQVLETKMPGGTGTLDQGSKTSFFLPYNMDLTNSTDILKLTLTLRKPSPADKDTQYAYNNFIFGFTGTDNVNDGHLDTFFRLENAQLIGNTSTYTGVVRPFVPGTNTGIWQSSHLMDENTNSEVFSTISLQYDPMKVNTQPWSLIWNGVETEFPKSVATSYNALTKIGGVGFGSFSASTSSTPPDNQDRTMWLRDFKFELIPQPDPGIDGDLNGDGFVGQDDLNLILG